MSKNYQKIKARIEELSAAERAKNITPDETVELLEKREELQRHEAVEELKKVKAAMAQAKRDALARILITNGIETENVLKDILRFVTEARPELMPGKKKPENKPERGEKVEAASTDAGACRAEAKAAEIKAVKPEPVAEEITAAVEPEPEKEKLTPLERARAEFARRNPNGFAAAERSKNR